MSELIVTVSDHKNRPLTGFQAGVIHGNGWHIPYQDISSPLDTSALPKGANIRVALNGPALRGGQTRNLVYEIETTDHDGRLDFTLAPYREADLYDAGQSIEDKHDHDFDAAAAAEPQVVMPPPDSGPDTYIQERHIRVQVNDSTGGLIDGYKAYLRFWGYPRLTKTKDVSGGDVGFYIPGGRPLCVCDIWKEDPSGQVIVGTFQRARFYPGAGNDIVMSFQIPRRVTRLLDPPASFHYIDGDGTLHRSDPPHYYRDHGHDKPRSALARALQRECVASALAQAKRINPTARNIRLTAMVSADHGYFNLAPARNYHWTAFKWGGDGQIETKLSHDVRVDQLLVEWDE